MAEPDKRIAFWLQEEVVSLSTKDLGEGARTGWRPTRVDRRAGALRAKQESTRG